MFFFLFLLKKQQHLQREKQRGGEAVNGGERSSLLKPVCKTLQLQNPAQDSVCGIQSFQEFSLKKEKLVSSREFGRFPTIPV